MYMELDDWRNDHNMSGETFYKRKFSYFGVRCSDGSLVWLKPYYKKYIKWTSNLELDETHYHIDFIENITEQEYVFRKLAENL